MYWNRLSIGNAFPAACWIVTLDVLKSYNDNTGISDGISWIVTLDVLK